MACQWSFSFACGILVLSRLLGLGLPGAGAQSSEGGTCNDELDRGINVMQLRVAATKRVPSLDKQTSSRRRVQKLGTQILETAAKNATPGPKTINGKPCDDDNIVVVASQDVVVEGHECVSGAPHFDPEGMVCGNDGHHLHEAYCSYEVGASHCAYCKSESTEVLACKGNRDTWDAGWGLCETYNKKFDNFPYCGSDKKHNLVAAEVCSECGICKQAEHLVYYTDLGPGWCVVKREGVAQIGYHGKPEGSLSFDEGQCKAVCDEIEQCSAYNFSPLITTSNRCIVQLTTEDRSWVPHGWGWIDTRESHVPALQTDLTASHGSWPFLENAGNCMVKADVGEHA